MSTRVYKSPFDVIDETVRKGIDKAEAIKDMQGAATRQELGLPSSKLNLPEDYTDLPKPKTFGSTSSTKTSTQTYTPITLDDYQAYIDEINKGTKDQLASLNNLQANADTRFEEGLAAYQRIAEQQKQDLALTRDKQRREAGVMLDKVGNYLANMYRSQGISGSGLSGQMSLQMYNDQLARMTAADASYESGAREVDRTQAENERALKSDKSAADAERETTRMSIQDAGSKALADLYGKIADENARREYEKMTLEEQRAYDEQVALSQTVRGNLEGELLTMYSDALGDGKYISQEDYDNLKTYAEEHMDQLTNSDKTLIQNQLRQWERTIGKKGVNANADIKFVGKLSAANDDYGDNFKVKVGGTEYPVEKGNDADASLNKQLIDVFKEEQGSKPAKGSALVYEGKVYMYLYNNETGKTSWCCIQRRENGKQDQWEEFCHAVGVEAYDRGKRPKSN